MFPGIKTPNLRIFTAPWLIKLTVILVPVTTHGSTSTPTTQSTIPSVADFVQEDMNSCSFRSILANISAHQLNTVQCASECVKYTACDGFYVNVIIHGCVLGTGGLVSTPSSSFLENHGVLMYRNKAVSIGVCPTSEGFKDMVINGKRFCFLLVVQTVTYHDAKQGCESRGAVLFHFDDEPEKYRQLLDISGMFENNGKNFWIGLHSPDSNSNLWFWDHSGQQLTSTEMLDIDWISGSQSVRTACANVRVTSRSTVVDDDPCTNNNDYLCEMHL